MGAAASMFLTGAQAWGGFRAQGQQANAVLAQGEYSQRVSEFNAREAETAAADAIARGGRAGAEYTRQTRQTLGSQRAALAAQGIDVNTGSAAAVQEDTAKLSALDILQIQNNAALEAHGYKVQALESRLQGEMALSGAKQESSALRRASYGTLLTGFSDIGYQYSERARAPKSRARSSSGGRSAYSSVDG